MITKIKNFIKEEWKFIIFLIFLYLVMTYELPYVIYIPGGTINMSERVTGDNLYKENGSISLTYVSVMKGRLPYIGLSYIMRDWDISDLDEVTYKNKDFEETIKIDKLMLEEAMSNAELVAYKAANVDYTIKSTKNIITDYSENETSPLTTGDEIISIDGNDIDDIKSLQTYLLDKKIGDKVKVKYKKDDKEYEADINLIDISGKAKIGISLATINEYDTPYNISIKTKDSESGPSGGLMSALAIYNQITPKDITNGKQIMGTGTISSDGSVGAIGGVKYKLIGAVNHKADVFIVPEENYSEALNVKNEKKYDIILISAASFDEAVQKLSEVVK